MKISTACLLLTPSVFCAYPAHAQWVATGPFPTTGGQVEGLGGQSSPVAGAIKAVAASPTDANVMYVGAVNGGIWKTTNATSANPTWTSQTDFQTSLSIGALQFDPTDASGNTLIAGIGRFSSFGGLGGAFSGLMRTTNGGSSWTPLISLSGKEISGVVERDSTIVASIDFATSFTYANIGVFRSTDGGASFTRISSGNPNSAGVHGLYGGRAYDLASNPSNTNTLYTAVRDAGTNDGVYRSSDTGATWTRVGSAALTNLFNDLTTVNAKIAVGNSGQVYVGVQNNGQLAGVFRSPDGVNNWTQLDTPTTNQNGFIVGINPEAELGGDEGDVPEVGSNDDISGGQGGIHFSITADPTNANIVYVGGDRQPSQLNRSGFEIGAFPNSIGADNYSGRLFRVDASLSAGSQATPITNNFTANGSSPHADSRSLTFDAVGNLIESDDGGIYRRTSPTTSSGQWSGLVGNLQVAEIHSIAYDHNTHTLFAGTQDTGTIAQATSGATSWFTVAQGDGGKVAVDNHGIGSVQYSGYVFMSGFQRRTFNSLGVFTGSSSPALNVVGVGLPVNHQDSNGNFDVDPGIQFYNPIAVNTINGDLLVGGRYIYESINGGSNLNRLGDLGSGNYVNALAGGGGGSNPNPSVLYAVGTGATFARRLSGTPSSAVILMNSYSAVSSVSAVALAISSKDWSDLFVASPENVFESTDAGSSFNNITGNLRSLETNIHALVEVTVNSLEYILAGGDNGVFLIGGIGFGTWSELGAQSLPNVPVYSLVYDASDDYLIAGTLGRGAWEIPNFSHSLMVPEPASLALASLASVIGIVGVRLAPRRKGC